MFLSSLITLGLFVVYLICWFHKIADSIVRQFFISTLISCQMTIVIYYLSGAIL